MSSVEISNKIFCAIDTTDLDFALQLASKLKGLIGGVKLGKEFFAAHGPAGVAQVSRTGHRIFLDIKKKICVIADKKDLDIAQTAEII